jgi:hypothetical protein
MDMEGVFGQKLDHSQAILANMNSSMKATLEEMEADREARKPTDLETNPEEIQSEEEDLEVPKKYAAVETGKAPNKRHWARNLAAGRSGEQKERTRGNGGCRNKLTASCRGMTRRAGMARLKGNVVR